MSNQIPCTLSYVPPDQASNVSGRLGVVGFASALEVPDIPMQQLGDRKLVELWEARDAVTHRNVEGVQIAEAGEVIFGWLSVPSAGAALAQVAAEAYERLGRAASSTAKPYFLRVWNHVPQINTVCEGLEQYQRFSVGRHEGLASLHFEFNEDLPAASAVGSDGSALDIFFLAAKAPGQQLENPRQVSAYRYPREYGPKSPSFSRATLKQWNDDFQLFVSGTASIVGHRTMHEGNLDMQLKETMRNLEAVLEVAATRASRTVTVDHVKALKIYVRNAVDATAIERALREVYGESTQMLLLRADICRKELLLEIEAYAEF